MGIYFDAVYHAREGYDQVRFEGYVQVVRKAALDCMRVARGRPDHEDVSCAQNEQHTVCAVAHFRCRGEGGHGGR